MDIGKILKFSILFIPNFFLFRVYNPSFSLRAIQCDPKIREYHSEFQNNDVALGLYDIAYYSDSGIFV